MANVPTPATNHMPQQVLQNQIDKGHIPPPGPNVIWDNPLVSNAWNDHQTLHGTSGADVFVFDVGAAIAAHSGVDSGSGYPFFMDAIDNFQLGVDQIAFVNIPPSDFLTVSGGNAFVSGAGDPTLPDGYVTAEAPASGRSQFFYTVATPDKTGTLMNSDYSLPVALSHDYTITLLNGHVVTLPPDPWLIA
ncbi:hypothetical protein [Bradyrhizobium sp. DASA03120]|uniref:hypothetical protein n=1 Tax=Bradyrhizobium sp. SMVTL-02 TaxID=3395917 RepID=UPI003F6E6F1D